MAFLLRRPFSVTATLKQAGPRWSTSVRAFHNTPLKQHPHFFSNKAPSVSTSQNVSKFRQPFRRSYQQAAYNPAAQGDLRQRLIYGAGIFGFTLLGINLIFNRETREDGGMPPYERAYLNDTFLHTGLGVGVIAIAARALHMNGWSFRLMSANPWLVLGVGLAGSIGTMFGTRATDPRNYVQKYALWSAFNVTQALLLSPLFFMNPAILARAGLYTAGLMGSLAFVGATAKTDKYLYLGGPLLAGVAIVALSGFAPLVLPVTATRTLMVTENLWLYGGLAVFGGFTLYDVQKVLHHARMAEQGLIPKDPVNEAISLELDFINIFVRMAQILAMSQNRRK
ncbi:inhibitor of apoptosis-promoting Bax1-domain-containing protein [Phaeosphaeria sp. MPI-PUGE-AT-0046c]|nr:inhibitor of apoptosis-promoting Bax1-domain-containing protein [Phaeosphaeria sp. MPI-PUGE-AT-0046c]